MLSELLRKASLFRFLLCIDIDLAKQVQEKGCPYCKKALHTAYYQRKPRGGPPDIPPECLIRRSLCCSDEACRRRTLPPSSLFLGRRVYWGSVVIIVMTLRQGRAQGESLARLERMFGICRQTLKRWKAFFRDEFPQSPTWKRLRGNVISTVSDAELPGALLTYFLACSPTTTKAVASCLRFLATGTIKVMT